MNEIARSPSPSQNFSGPPNKKKGKNDKKKKGKLSKADIGLPSDFRYVCIFCVLCRSESV